MSPRRDGAQSGDRFDELRLAVPFDAGDAEDLARRDAEETPSTTRCGARASPTRRSRTSSSAATAPSSARTLRAVYSASSASATSRPTIARAIVCGVVPAVRMRVDGRPARITVIVVGDLDHLVELVRDEDDRPAVVAQRAQHGPELAHFRRREHGGRLVEDEDLRAAIERLEDLDALRLADREIGHERVGRRPRVRSCADSSRHRRSAARAIELRVPFVGSRPSTTFSATVSVGTSMKCWCTMPTPAAIASAVVQPGDVAAVHFACVPASGAYSPPRMRISVDLPAPFSPTSAWISPRRDLERSRRGSPGPAPNDLSMPVDADR